MCYMGRAIASIQHRETLFSKEEGEGCEDMRDKQEQSAQYAKMNAKFKHSLSILSKRREKECFIYST